MIAKKGGFLKGDGKKKVGNAKKADVPFGEEAGKWKFIIASHVFVFLPNVFLRRFWLKARVLARNTQLLGAVEKAGFPPPATQHAIYNL